MPESLAFTVMCHLTRIQSCAIQQGIPLPNLQGILKGISRMFEEEQNVSG